MGVVVREKVKGSGEWWVYIAHKGYRRARKIGSKREANEWAKAIRRKLLDGEFNLESVNTPTFGATAEKWLEGYIRPLRRESTYSSYRNVLKKHVPATLKAKRLDQITRGHVRDLLLAKFEGGLSRSRVAVIKDVFSGVFNYAIDEELISVNPVIGITKRLGLTRKGEERKADFLTREELELLLDTCQTLYPPAYPFFLCAARTGMRLGELLALRWGDLDFNSRFIVVRRSYRRGRFTPPKNGKERRVDMSDQLASTLAALRARAQRGALKRGEPVPELVFCREGGAVVEQNYIRRVFKRVLTKAGLREIRLHDLRHTFASLLIGQGESLAYVKEQLGHHSIEMTVDIYGHLIPGSNRDAVNRLDTKKGAQLQPDATERPSTAATSSDYSEFLAMVPKRGLEPLQGTPY